MEKSIIGNIDSKTFNTIGRIASIIPSTILVSDIVLSYYYPDIHYIMTAGVFLTGFGGMYFNMSDLKNYTSDVKETMILYNEFLNNYNKLNKMFDFNDPTQVYTLYTYLYKNGFLSKDKQFVFDNERKYNNITACMGCDVINGSGVCRNISAMLVDILNNYGMSSLNLGVYQNGYFVAYDKSLLKGYTKEELIEQAKKLIVDEDRLDIVIKEINEFEEPVHKKILLCDDLDFLNPTKLTGNHAITFTYHNGKKYFMDPTQETTYRMSMRDKALYDKYERLKIKSSTSKFLSHDKNCYKEIGGKIFEDVPMISREEEKQIILGVRDIIKNNGDLLESFYSENKELYDEISESVLKLK